MNQRKKLNIVKSKNRMKFFKFIFSVWTDKKRNTPGKLICFWCEKIMEPDKYFRKPLYFAVSRGGEIFESPVFGHEKFNKLYQDTFNAELCELCYHNLNMFNRTGLWFLDNKTYKELSI